MKNNPVQISFARWNAGIKFLPLFILILSIPNRGETQIPSQHAKTKEQGISVEEFYDSWHHWYDINDGEKIIVPEENQKRYDKTEIRGIADNILLYQKENGGWPKNYDMLAIVTPEQKAALLASKNEQTTTFDNGATHSQILYLARAFRKTKDARYAESATRGIEFILSAQYSNGGWPQFFPDTGGYRKHITFNDGAMIGIMKVLKRIVEHEKSFLFVPTDLRERAGRAYQAGLECILKCQIRENGKTTAWCQQHHYLTLAPVAARAFEPAAISNGESSGIVSFLMSIQKPSPEIIAAVESAVEWFKSSVIQNTIIDTIPASEEHYQYHTTKMDRVVRLSKNAPDIWTRYYELGTHKPLFCNRDGIPVYSLAEVERERRTGYSWYVYLPAEVLKEYPVWKKRIGLE